MDSEYDCEELFKQRPVSNFIWTVLILLPILLKLVGATSVSWLVALLPLFLFASTAIVLFVGLLVLTKPWQKSV